MARGIDFSVSGCLGAKNSQNARATLLSSLAAIDWDEDRAAPSPTCPPMRECLHPVGLHKVHIYLTTDMAGYTTNNRSILNVFG